jgi:eukaryotic-like serine/threonine-protein kinase
LVAALSPYNPAHPLALTPGTRLGPYEIVAAIGAGGMGEVYKARDTRLDRDVAIKILPEAFAADADRVARFQREAKTLAALNHPNIAQIFGLEQAGDVRALAMEFVAGEDLSDRIARGPIPLDEALPIAKQIAEALEAAHEQGIIHRDLKPANIKVRADGTVKVLDFGLAKALDPLASSPVVSQSPTITSPALTQLGVIVGTAAYMSPEQARGRAVDKRSDIWAFGVILFEMLTGRRAFDGETISDVLAKVIEREPDWNALPTSTPPGIHRLLRWCLEKDRHRRLADIADARLDIDGTSADPVTRSLERTGGLRPSPLVSVALLLAAFAVVGAAFFLKARSSPTATSAPVTRLDLNLPPHIEVYTAASRSFTVSPDGTQVAFIGVESGVRQLYVRRLDQPEATKVPIRQTEGVNCVFYSPDGHSLGFTTASSASLGTISIADGLVVPLTTGVNFNAGGAWTADGKIIFAKPDGLWQIPAKGGVATQITKLDSAKGELAHMWPIAIRDGARVLFTVITGGGRDASHIEVITLNTGERKALVDQAASSLYASSGHLLFLRDNSVVAAHFDAESLAVSGPFVRVLENVAVDRFGGPLAAISDAGTLVYVSRLSANTGLVWSSRVGLEEPIMDPGGYYQHPRLSPNGQKILVTHDGDLWIRDASRKTFEKVTSNSTAVNGFSTWTPDGTRVVFQTQAGMAWMSMDGSGHVQPIAGTSSNDYPNSVSPIDGMLAFIHISGETSADIYTVSLDGDKKPHAILQSKAFEGAPQISPDGKWLAYVSDESGPFEVYVRPFPVGDRRSVVSTSGGTQPRWNRNGKEIFYRNGDKMMAVSLVSIDPDLRLSAPRLLFERHYAYGSSITTPNYDVSLDGQQFVMVKNQSDSWEFNVVLNWFEELRRLVPRK